MSWERHQAGDLQLVRHHAREMASSRLFDEAAGAMHRPAGKAGGAKDAVNAGEFEIPPLEYAAPAGQYRDGAKSVAHSLSAEAQSAAGQKLWRKSKYAHDTDGGKLGCAASASLVLEKAGYKFADSPTVGGLVNQLKAHRFTLHPASEAREGDVMVAYNPTRGWKSGGGNAHIGIVSADGTVYNNSSRQGETWVSEPADIAFEKYALRYVLRPPAARR